MQRLIFVNRFFYPDISATSQILFDLTTRLAAQGDVEVHVVCSRLRYDNTQDVLPADDVVRGVVVHRVRTTHFGRVGLKGRAVDYATFYPSATLRLLALARSGDMVIAKTDPPLISLAAALVARLRGARLINWLQDVFPEVAANLGANPLPPRLDRWLRSLRDWSLRCARTNVVLGSRMREHVLGRGVAADQICVIENWADDAAIQPLAVADSALRTKLKLQRNFVVAYSGNLGRAHDFRTLLGAAEQLACEPGVTFLMIGGGVLMEQLRREVEQRKLANFIFLPYQDRDTLADSLAAADVHLTCLRPSLEGLIVPSKFYGVLAAERPVIFIGDADGELARAIRKADCGAVVEIDDSAGLAAQLRRMRADSEYRQASGRRARALLSSRYSVGIATSKWNEVLREPAPAPLPSAEEQPSAV